MATALDLLGTSDDFGDDDEALAQLDAALSAEATPIAAQRNPGRVAAVDFASGTDAVVIPSPASKDALDVRGFFVGAGEGIYDGAVRAGEEPSENFFVDYQDYANGEIKRVWGVALRDAITQAMQTKGIQPGSRVRLQQGGKQKTLSDGIKDGVMVFSETYANAWTISPDASPLPAHLSHLVSGINIDQELIQIAVRYDLAPDSADLTSWKAQQRRQIDALGDDPQKIKAWISRQYELSSDEERALIERGLELDGYVQPDERRAREQESRLRTLRDMGSRQRFDYLMKTAKPDLIDRAATHEGMISAQVMKAINSYAEFQARVMDQQGSPLYESALVAAMRQTISGLTPEQQLGEVMRRRDHVLQAYLCRKPLGASDDVASPDAIIDASSMTAEQYEQALLDKLGKAGSQKEAQEMFAQEMNARRQEYDGKKAVHERYDALWSRIAAERDIDILALLASQGIARSVGWMLKAPATLLNTTYQKLGGVMGWRKNAAESALDLLSSSLTQAKETDEYQAFLKDPLVASAANGRDIGVMVHETPGIEHTDVGRRHVVAQEEGVAPAAGPDHSRAKGIWSNVLKNARVVQQCVSDLTPESLIKSGKLDGEWIDRMQGKIADFGKQVAETLMSAEVRQQLQEMLERVIESIRMLVQAVRELLAPKSASVAAPGA